MAPAAEVKLLPRHPERDVDVTSARPARSCYQPRVVDIVCTTTEGAEGREQRGLAPLPEGRTRIPANLEANLQIFDVNGLGNPLLKPDWNHFRYC